MTFVWNCENNEFQKCVLLFCYKTVVIPSTFQNAEYSYQDVRNNNFVSCFVWVGNEFFVSILSEQLKLQTAQNEMLRRIIRSKMGDVSEQFWMLHNKKPCHSYRLPTGSQEARLAELGVRMSDTRNPVKIFVGKPLWKRIPKRPRRR
jgi:hypothetical protein